jgi:4-hydroxy-3-methylbut-2-en-1-yl diphosphate reductase
MKRFKVPVTYRSPLITAIKERRRQDDRLKKDFSPTLLDFGPLNIWLARHFGFCYGVENAIEIAFRTVEEHPGKRIFLLSEMIHNPFVNADLQAKGVRFLMDTKGNALVDIESLTADDVVIIPAFGTTLDMERRLREKGIPVERYDTTCPFVEKVWNRSEQIARKGYTVVVHGKPSHEETRATFSHSAAHAPTIVVTDMEEARVLAEFIRGQRSQEEFKSIFKDRCSAGFNISKDLQRIGVVNQTTMLAGDTQAIADYLKDVIKALFGPDPEKVSEHFADTRDTLCYATMDNQTAVTGMLETEADLAFVVGGRNSSNTSHLVELCEQKLPTFFIRSEADLMPDGSVLHTDWQTQQEHLLEKCLPTDKTPVRILLTSGASCPDAIVEQVIRRLSESIPGTRTFAEVMAEWV